MLCRFSVCLSDEVCAALPAEFETELLMLLLRVRDCDAPPGTCSVWRVEEDEDDGPGGFGWLEEDDGGLFARVWRFAVTKARRRPKGDDDDDDEDEEDDAADESRTMLVRSSQ